MALILYFDFKGPKIDKWTDAPKDRQSNRPMARKAEKTDR